MVSPLWNVRSPSCWGLKSYSALAEAMKIPEARVTGRTGSGVAILPVYEKGIPAFGDEVGDGDGYLRDEVLRDSVARPDSFGGKRKGFIGGYVGVTCSTVTGTCAAEVVERTVGSSGLSRRLRIS